MAASALVNNKLIANLPFSAKLGLIVVALLVPLTLMVWFLVAEKRELIDFAENELVGVGFVADAQRAVYIAAPAEGAAVAAGVQRASSGPGAKLGIGEAGKAAAAKLGGAEAMSAASDVAALLVTAADTSNVSLDPDMDTYYLGDLVVNAVPDLVDRVRMLAQLAAAKDAPELVAARLELQRQAVESALGNIDTHLKKAAAGNVAGTLGKLLEKPGSELTAATRALLAATEKPADARAGAALKDVLQAASRLVETATPALRDLIQARIDGFWHTLFARLGIAGVMTLVAIGLWIAVVRSTTGPLREITGVMTALARGEDREVAIADRRDEIGVLAKSAQHFREVLAQAAALRAEQQAAQERQLERGQRIEASVGEFERHIAEIVSIVSSAAAELHATAGTMSETAERTTAQSAHVAAASDHATHNVKAVAAASEELAASIREISGQVAHTSTSISAAASQAAEGNEQVRGLTEASERIGEVVGMISEIAGKTNLLALNATIEAARAGEAGKGFAVVASEVKALANQTARATEEISAQIRTIQETIQRSAHAMRGVGETIGKVDGTAAAIAAAVEEQGSATREIARNVEEAAKGTSEVADSIASVSTAAQHTAAAATQVLASADELSRNGELLRQQVEQFLTAVRAA